MDKRPPIIIPDKSGVPSREDIEKAIEKVNREIREQVEKQRQEVGLS